MSEILNYNDCIKILTDFNIKPILGFKISTLEQAVNKAKELKFPVCLKLDPDIFAHKSDVSGVKTNIKNEQELRNAFFNLESITKQQIKQLDNSLIKENKSHLLIQKMVASGIELIVGIKNDPVFGSVLTVGLGGIFTEILKKVAIRPIPLKGQPALAKTEIFKMLDRINVGNILNGFRGKEPVNQEKTVELIYKIAKLAQNTPNISEADFNPVICNSKEAHIVDMLILITPKSRKTYQTYSKRFPVESIGHFFEPHNIAVIGASRSQDKGGHIIVKNLKSFGFKGQVFPINPNTDYIEGYRCYGDITKIPVQVALAIVIIPSKNIDKAIESCVRAKVKAVIIVTAGFSDTGKKGRAQEEKIARELNKAGIRLMGPNSIGTISMPTDVATSITTVYKPKKGNVAIFGQSGVFSSGVVNKIATDEAYGISRIACIGNRADVDESDMLEWLLNDEETNIIAMYVEGIKHGRRFLSLLQKAKNKKQIIVLKSGKSEQGAQALVSHTGALAVNDKVFDGIIESTGAIRVRDLDQLTDTIKFCALSPFYRQKKVNKLAVISISGMGCVNSADLAPDYGFVIPEYSPDTIKKIQKIMPAWAPLKNPTDIWSTIEANGAEKAYFDISAAAIQDKNIDALFLIFLLIPESDFNILKTIKKLQKVSQNKPIFATLLAGDDKLSKKWRKQLEQADVPCYFGIDQALGAASTALNFKS